MEALKFLSDYPRLIGECSFWMFFSALDISKEYKISIYKSRKLVRVLRDAGIVKRFGNKYVLDNDGRNVAYTLRDAKERGLRNVQ